MKLLKISVSG